MPRPGRGHPRLARAGVALALIALSASCALPFSQPGAARAPSASPLASPPLPSPTATPSPQPPASPKSPTASTSAPSPSGARGTVTLGFAGDVHFADQLGPLLDDPDTALAPIAPALRKPDLMMVNLETAITDRGTPEPKRFHFRTSPRALDALAAAGVDVVTMGNNHAVDYGPLGLQDTLAAVRRSPIGVVGIGSDREAALRPHVVSIRGTQIAVLGATTLPDRTALAWAAGPGKPGVAVALLPRPDLTRAVRAARKQADVVVVYLHWGEENESCPYWRPLRHARELAAAGADIVVGSHAHVLLGAGWSGATYVDYGLGNFVWYSQSSLTTGILTLTVRDGRVVSDSFSPAHIGSDGRPRLLDSGPERHEEVAAWQRLRGCTDLAARPRR